MTLVNITAIARCKGGRQDAYRQLAGAAHAGDEKSLHPSTVQLPAEAFRARFWSHVHKTPDCWLWTGALNADGYGVLTVGRQPYRAHRLSWILHRGPISPGVHILHKCDVRHCVRPRDLFAGGQAANMKDAAAKGRLHVARLTSRRLSDAAMREIVMAPAERGIGNRLAAKFAISKTYVSMLRRGLRVWRPASIGLGDQRHFGSR